jgi:curved DNA-binding protein CbpA
MPLPRLLFELYLGTYTGTVRLVRKGAERTIYFRGGFPVYVDSSQLDETLSAVLERSGRIAEAQLERAKQVGSERDIYMGEALVSIGALRESELLDALRDQTEYKLVASFSWRDGKFAIEELADFPEHVVPSEIHPLTAILRGISAHYELSALFRYFSKLQNRYVVSTPMFAVHHSSILPHLEHFDPKELLDGQTTFERALRSDDAHSLEIAQALYVLLVTDMVRPSKKPGDPAPEVETPVEEKAAIGLADYQSLMDAADRIAHRYLRAKGSDYFALFGVERGASTREIARTYRKQVAEIREDAGLPGLPHDSQRRARELIDLLDTARGVLTNAKRREEYLAELPDETEAQEKTELASGREAALAAERAYKLGVRLLNEGDADGAYDELDGAVRSNPVEPTYRVALAQAIQAKFKENRGQALGLAYSHIEQALRIDPGNILANLEAARIFLGEKQTAAARSHVEKVLQRVGHHKGALKLLAEIESAGGEEGRA